jgi:hypothetical protein
MALRNLRRLGRQFSSPAVILLAVDTYLLLIAFQIPVSGRSGGRQRVGRKSPKRVRPLAQPPDKLAHAVRFKKMAECGATVQDCRVKIWCILGEDLTRSFEVD